MKETQISISHAYIYLPQHLIVSPWEKYFLHLYWAFELLSYYKLSKIFLLYATCRNLHFGSGIMMSTLYLILTQSTTSLPSSLAPQTVLASSQGLEGRKTSTELTGTFGALPVPRETTTPNFFTLSPCSWSDGKKIKQVLQASKDKGDRSLTNIFTYVA